MVRGVLHPERPLTAGQRRVLEAIHALHAVLQRRVSFVEVQDFVEAQPDVTEGAMTRGAIPAAIQYLQRRGFVVVRYSGSGGKAKVTGGRRPRRFVTPLDVPMIPGTREYGHVADKSPQGVLEKLVDRSPPRIPDGVPTLGRGVTIASMRRWEPATPDYRGETVRLSDRGGSAYLPGRSFAPGTCEWSGAE